MKTWAQWDDTRPGFLEIDLVGHDGGDNNGQFCFTLTATDVATGWTMNRTVAGKVNAASLRRWRKSAWACRSTSPETHSTMAASS